MQFQKYLGYPSKLNLLNSFLQSLHMKLDGFINTTSNQHFISQAEQRLNSCSLNPKSRKSEINRFEILEKNPPKVSSSEKVTISRNLSFQEIFTIQRLSDSERLNFENLFGRYEAEFPARAAHVIELVSIVRKKNTTNSERIDLKKVNDVDFQSFLEDVKFIYKYKIMNGLRNPYQIKDTLNDFKFILDHVIDDEAALNIYISLELKNNSEERYICDKFNISKNEYKEWIRLLLLFLFPKKDGTTILDGFIEQFFKATEFYTTIFICIFDNNCALLTDTGVVKDNGLDDDLTTYMNISKNCIVSLTHTKIEGDRLDKICKDRGLTDNQKRQLVIDCSGAVSGLLFINNLEFLSGYNKICVQAAAKNVFSGSSEIAGVEILKRC